MAEDGNVIETGYYELDEHVICISSQIGCQMGCIFCATTMPIDGIKSNPFVRNLSVDEIVEQVDNIVRVKQKKKNFDDKKILFSYMGMGEPFLNYENVVTSVKILSKKFPNSRTTISTLGVNSKLIRQLAETNIDTTLKLHLSLHAPNDKLRKKILPNAGKISTALEALNFFSSTKGTKTKVNYILIKDLNDSEKQAIELSKLLKPYSFIVKLSNLNDINYLASSELEKFDLFEKILAKEKIKTCKFFSTGVDIKAGCGQLRRYYAKKHNN